MCMNQSGIQLNISFVMTISVKLMCTNKARPNFEKSKLWIIAIFPFNFHNNKVATIAPHFFPALVAKIDPSKSRGDISHPIRDSLKPNELQLKDTDQLSHAKFHYNCPDTFGEIKVWASTIFKKKTFFSRWFIPGPINPFKMGVQKLWNYWQKLGAAYFAAGVLRTLLEA